MKCIKLIKNSKGHEIGEILRIDDNEAEMRVKGGNWAFAPKTEYKLFKNPDYKTKPTEKVVSKKQSKKTKTETNEII
jgi:3-dehydroquinate synthase class II